MNENKMIGATWDMRLVQINSSRFDLQLREVETGFIDTICSGESPVYMEWIGAVISQQYHSVFHNEVTGLVIWNNPMGSTIPTDILRKAEHLHLSNGRCVKKRNGELCT